MNRRWGWSRPSVERLADPEPLPDDGYFTDPIRIPLDDITAEEDVERALAGRLSTEEHIASCSICQRNQRRQREATDRLLAAMARPDEPQEEPTVVLSVTGPDGLALDLRVTGDLDQIRTLIDEAFSYLIAR